MDSKLYSNTLGYTGSGGNDAPSLLAPGMVIDGFELLEKLHVGGMAHLWRVQEVNHQGDSRLPLIISCRASRAAKTRPPSSASRSR